MIVRYMEGNDNGFKISIDLYKTLNFLQMFTHSSKRKKIHLTSHQSVSGVFEVFKIIIVDDTFNK
jgi:hypothetical protein